MWTDRPKDSQYVPEFNKIVNPRRVKYCTFHKTLPKSGLYVDALDLGKVL